jgi:hypothetical protein
MNIHRRTGDACALQLLLAMRDASHGAGESRDVNTNTGVAELVTALENSGVIRYIEKLAPQLQ